MASSKRKKDKSSRVVSRLLANTFSGEELSARHRKILAEHGMRVDSTLEERLQRIHLLLNGPDDVPVHALAEVLGQVPAPVVEAVASVLCRRKHIAVLMELRPLLPDKGAQKSLGRAIHQLSCRGIATGETRAPRLAVDGRSKARMIPRESPQAWLSSPDLAENPWVGLFAPFPDGASIFLASLSETQGIVDPAIDETHARGILREIKAGAAAREYPLFLIPPPHALFLIESAMAAAREAGHLVPSVVDQFLERVKTTWNMKAEQARPKGWETMTPQVGAPDEDFDWLMLSPLVVDWTMDPALLDTAIHDMMKVVHSPLILTEKMRIRRLDAINEKTAKAFFVPKVRRRFARRLEEYALYLDAEGEENHARAAFRSALALSQTDLPVSSIPFATGFVQLQMVQRVTELTGQYPEPDDDERLSNIEGPAPDEQDTPRIILP